jgi:hypothetical protein
VDQFVRGDGAEALVSRHRFEDGGERLDAEADEVFRKAGGSAVREVLEIVEQDRDLAGLVLELGAVEVEGGFEAADHVLHQVFVRRVVIDHLYVVGLLVIKLGESGRGRGG